MANVNKPSVKFYITAGCLKVGIWKHYIFNEGIWKHHTGNGGGGDLARVNRKGDGWFTRLCLANFSEYNRLKMKNSHDKKAYLYQWHCTMLPECFVDSSWEFHITMSNQFQLTATMKLQFIHNLTIFFILGIFSIVQILWARKLSGHEPILRNHH